VSALFISDDKGQCSRIFYGAQVLYLTVAIASDSKYDRFPCIDICYPDKVIPTALAIAKAMAQQQIAPRVFIDQKGDGAYVVVLFRLPGVRKLHMFVRELSLNAQKLLEKNIAPTGVEIIMTAEAMIDAKIVQKFRECFEQIGFLRLYLIDDQAPIKGTSLWSVDLSSFTEGLPPAPD
jgi:hypothetical protein